METRCTFKKEERLCSNTCIDRLFKEGNRQIAVFPVRLVWMLVDKKDINGVQLLISAPKRNFHHAVSRNRIKRQIREFYRKSSAPLKEIVAGLDKGLAIAILFNDTRLWKTASLEPRLRSALERLADSLAQLQPKEVEKVLE